MDEITFIKKNDGTNDELSCHDCVFEDACMRSGGEMCIMLDCEDGDYWEIKK